MDDIGVYVKVAFPQDARRLPDHEQAVFLYPAQHRPLVQVPAAESGCFRYGVGVVQLWGQLITPDHLTVVIQDHGPGVPLHPLFRGVGRAKVQLTVLLYHGGGDLAGSMGLGLVLDGVPPAQPTQQPGTQPRQQQDQDGNGQYVAADQPPECLHTVPSRVSL